MKLDEVAHDGQADAVALHALVAAGNQLWNPITAFEAFGNYPTEQRELLDFLRRARIPGLLFLTGDRHHSEIIRFSRVGSYPLYDITSSPLTSGTGIAGGKEKDNPYREPKTLVEAQNYTRITVSGKQNDRTLKVEFLGIKGELITSWSVSEKALKQP